MPTKQQAKIDAESRAWWHNNQKLINAPITVDEGPEKPYTKYSCELSESYNCFGCCVFVLGAIIGAAIALWLVATYGC